MVDLFGVGFCCLYVIGVVVGVEGGFDLWSECFYCFGGGVFCFCIIVFVEVEVFIDVMLEVENCFVFGFGGVEDVEFCV